MRRGRLLLPWGLLAGLLLWSAAIEGLNIKAPSLLKKPRTTLNVTTTTTTTTTTTEQAEIQEELGEEEAPTGAEEAVEVSNSSNSLLTGDPQKDYRYDPNLPRELPHGYNLSEYPFFSRVPNDVAFECGDDLLDGYYANVHYKCQVYHHCLSGIRYDFLCANYTAFDQKTFICHFVSEVDCANSAKFWNRNKGLYETPTTTTLKPLTTAPPPTPAPTPAPARRPSGGASGRRRRPYRRRRPWYDDRYEDDVYDDEEYEEEYEDEPTGPAQSAGRGSAGSARARPSSSEAPADDKPFKADKSIYDRPRQAPQIRRPVPLNERDKYDYPGKASTSAPTQDRESERKRTEETADYDKPSRPRQNSRPSSVDDSYDEYYDSEEPRTSSRKHQGHSQDDYGSTGADRDFVRRPAMSGQGRPLRRNRPGARRRPIDDDYYGDERRSRPIASDSEARRRPHESRRRPSEDDEPRRRRPYDDDEVPSRKRGDEDRRRPASDRDEVPRRRPYDDEEVPARRRPYEDEVPARRRPVDDEVPSRRKQVDEEVPARRRPYSDEVPSRRKPLDDEVPSRRKPVEDEVPARRKPLDDEVPTRRKPVEDEVPTRRKPVEEEVPARRKPLDDEVPSRKKPVEDEVPTRRKPVEEVVPARRKPVEDEVPSRRKPLDEEVPSRRKPVEDEVPARRKPLDEEVPSRRKPVEEEVPARRQPAEVEVPTRRRPYSDEVPSRIKPIDEEIPSRRKPADVEVPSRRRPFDDLRVPSGPSGLSGPSGPSGPSGASRKRGPQREELDRETNYERAASRDVATTRDRHRIPPLPASEIPLSTYTRETTPRPRGTHPPTEPATRDRDSDYDPIPAAKPAYISTTGTASRSASRTTTTTTTTESPLLDDEEYYDDDEEVEGDFPTGPDNVSPVSTSTSKPDLSTPRSKPTARDENLPKQPGSSSYRFNEDGVLLETLPSRPQFRPKVTSSTQVYQYTTTESSVEQVHQRPNYQRRKPEVYPTQEATTEPVPTQPPTGSASSRGNFRKNTPKVVEFPRVLPDITDPEYDVTLNEAIHPTPLPFTSEGVSRLKVFSYPVAKKGSTLLSSASQTHEAKAPYPIHSKDEEYENVTEEDDYEDAPIPTGKGAEVPKGDMPIPTGRGLVWTTASPMVFRGSEGSLPLNQATTSRQYYVEQTQRPPLLQQQQIYVPTRNANQQYYKGDVFRGSLNPLLYSQGYDYDLTPKFRPRRKYYSRDVDGYFGKLY